MRVTALRNDSNGEESTDLRMLGDAFNRASVEPESRHTVAIIRLHGASGNDAENTRRALARIIQTLEDRLTLWDGAESAAVFDGAAAASCNIGGHSASTQFPEEVPHLPHEQIGLLEGSEVPAPLPYGPTLDIIDLFGN